MKNKPIPRRKALKKMSLLGLILSVGAFPVKAREILQKTRVIGKDIWDKLRGLIQGIVVSNQDQDYQSLRKKMVRNGLLPREQPDAIVQVQDEKDLAKIISFAQSNNLKVSVRGSGHHVSAPFMNNHSILVDISGLNSVKIDKSKQTAIVGAGISSKDFVQEALKYDLAFPAGHVASVPLSGFLLGGGYGWNSGAWGVACSNVMAVDVVNANAELIHANAEQNQAYYWAARGSGAGFFGIVTHYHLQLYQNPKSILSSTVIYPLKEVGGVVIWLDNLVGQLEPEVELGCFLAPDPENPENGKLIISATVFANFKEEAIKWLQPLDQGPKNYLENELNVAKEFSELQDTTTESDAQTRYYQDTFLTDKTPSDYLPQLFKLASVCPSKLSTLMVAFRPVADNISSQNMAYSMIGNTYIAAYGAWKSSDQDEENKAWVTKVTAFMKPLTKGYYVNESDLKRSERRPSQCFSNENWTKLEELRKAYDSKGLFTYFPTV